eukprot:15017509-Alexandrium_andersonii.AAC.1
MLIARIFGGMSNGRHCWQTFQNLILSEHAVQVKAWSAVWGRPSHEGLPFIGRNTWPVTLVA